MSQPLTVVITTRDRRPKLQATLEAVAEQAEQAEQAEPRRWQVVVIDDGSGDDTWQFLQAQLGVSLPFELRIERQEQLGPAIGRNRGIAKATGARILLLGDDTRPAPGCLLAHLDETGERGDGERGDGERGIQGHIDWDPRQPITPLMEFLAPAGPQFYFAGLTDERPIPYSAVLGSNFSAPRRWFLEEPYDEGFPHAAFEDTELAYRWQKRGWRSVYRRRALCWHDHLYDDLTAFLERQKRAGSAARYAVRRHPGLWWKAFLEPTLYGIWSRCRRRGRQPSTTESWDLACRRAYRDGFMGR